MAQDCAHVERGRVKSRDLEEPGCAVACRGKGVGDTDGSDMKYNQLGTQDAAGTPSTMHITLNSPKATAYCGTWQDGSVTHAVVTFFSCANCGPKGGCMPLYIGAATLEPGATACAPYVAVSHRDHAVPPVCTMCEKNSSRPSKSCVLELALSSSHVTCGTTNKVYTKANNEYGDMPLSQQRWCGTTKERIANVRGHCSCPTARVNRYRHNVHLSLIHI